MINFDKINKSWLYIPGIIIWFSIVAAITGDEYIRLEEAYSGVSRISLTSERCIAEEQLKTQSDFLSDAVIQSFFDRGKCVRTITTDTLKNSEKLQTLFPNYE